MTLSPELIGLIAVFVAVLIGFGAVVKFLLTIKDEITNLKIETKTSITKLEVELKSEITNFKIETNERLSKIESKLDISDERYTSTKEQLSATTEQLISIKEQVSVTKEQIVVTNQRTDKLEAEVKDAKFEFRNITKELIKAFPKFSTNEVAKEPQLAT